MDVLVGALSWEPQVKGGLYVLLAILILPGSVYLVLATDMGARLGFQLAAAGLAGFMVIIGAVWWAYGIGPQGSAPVWREEAIVAGDPARSGEEYLEGFPEEWERLEVTDPEVADAQPVVDGSLTAEEGGLFGSAAEYLVWKLGLAWNQRVLNMVGSASNVSTGFVPASSWASVAGSDPFSQLTLMIEQLQATTAQRPNSVLMGWKAWAYMRRNTNLRNMLNGVNNGGGLVTRQQVQNLLEVDRFLVTEAFVNTANEAQAEALSSPFEDKVLVYYAPLQPSRDNPSFMYSFRQEVPGVPSLTAERHPYDSRRKIETVEVGYYQTEEIVGSPYGALLLGVGSAQANGLA